MFAANLLYALRKRLPPSCARTWIFCGSETSSLEKKEQKPLDKDLDWLKEFALDQPMARYFRHFDCSRRARRKFGLSTGGLLVLTLVISFLQHPLRWDLLSAGLALVALDALGPSALKCVYLPWMAIGAVLGAIVSTIVLTLLFYAIVTPIGLLARIVGKDFPGRKPDRTAPGHWQSRPAKKNITSSSFEFSPIPGAAFYSSGASSTAFQIL